MFEKYIEYQERIPEDLKPRYPTIIRPDEPIDIYFENLDDEGKAWKVFKSFALTICLLVACSGATLGANFWQNHLKEQETPEN